MLKREKRLQPINELAGRNERSHATRLAEVERRLAEAERRHEELLRYRTEYERSFHTRASAGAPMRGLREQQAFIARLTEALRVQQSTIEQLRADCATARHHWRVAATRKQMVGKVVDRARAETRSSEERRAQGESDERAQRARVRS